MRKICITLMGILALVFLQLNSKAQIVAWEVTGLTSYGSSPFAATSSNSNVTIGGITRGSGVGTGGTAASDCWGGTTWETANSAATAITNGKYATFSITANAGYNMSLSTIPAHNFRRSSSGASRVQWQYQVGSGSFINIGSEITLSTTTNTGNPQSAIDLSLISDLQNVASGVTVTFRIVNYNASGTGTWYIRDVTGNDMEVDGTVFSSPLYYRSIASGNWNANTTWESATDAAFTTPVNPALAAPDFNANTITIRNGHTITASADITTDQTTIENGGIVNIAPSIALSLNDGTGTDLTVATGGSLVFQSSNVGTARITNVGTATISSDNNVTVERYLNDRRAWRLINTPLTATANTTVVTNWQNNFGAGSGVGTNITGPTGTNGADFTSVSYSLKTFNSATQVLDNVTNISTANQFANPYFIFVRGDKTITTPTGHSATTLRAVGNLITGDQTVSATPGQNKFMLVGNPYASPVNFAGLTRTNIPNYFYVWDASKNSFGTYVTVSDDGLGGYDITPNTSTQTQHIQSGQSFFVTDTSAAAGSITFHETDKTANSTPAVFRTTATDEALNLTLSSVDAGNLTTVDGLRLKRNANYTNAIDAMDIKKFTNVNENLAISNGTENIVVEKKAPLTNTNDTVALKFWNTALKDYRISIDLSNISSAKAVYLLDAYTATTTALNLNGTTDYDFTVTNAAGSWDANRFKIVYEAKTALSIPTSQTSKGTIAVYPNPAKAGNTTLSMNGFAKGRYAITLYNVAGQQVMTTSIVHDGNNNAHVINLAGVATGTYQLQVANEATGSTTQKIIVQP